MRDESVKYIYLQCMVGCLFVAPWRRFWRRLPRTCLPPSVYLLTPSGTNADRAQRDVDRRAAQHPDHGQPADHRLHGDSDATVNPAWSMSRSPGGQRRCSTCADETRCYYTQRAATKGRRR
jgi:hypothetical protein